MEKIRHVKGHILDDERYAFAWRYAANETVKSRRNYRKSYKMLI